MARHRKKLLYRCYYCSARFSSSFKKYAHIQKSHAGRPRIVPDANNGENLENTKNQPEIPEDTNAKQQSSLRESTVTSTVTGHETDSCSDGQLKYAQHNCEFCSRRFSRLEKLRAHLRLEHHVARYQAALLIEERSNFLAQTCILTTENNQTDDEIPNSINAQQLQMKNQRKKRRKKRFESLDDKMNRSLTRGRCGYKCFKCCVHFRGRVELIRHYYENHSQLFQSQAVLPASKKDAQKDLKDSKELQPVESGTERSRNG